MNSGLPLVSFVVKCYNQSHYIAAAMDGVLAQTYCHIEYIIGDDASTDGSLAIVLDKLAAAGFCEDVAACKVDENRTIRRFLKGDVVAWVVRNMCNLGNCGNWQALCELAHGELFIKADGDDISLPSRTQRIVDEWLGVGDRCGIIYHNAFKIDRHGNEIGDVSKEVFERRLPLGAVMACSRKCFSAFGSVVDGFAADDTVYANRAEMIGLSVHRFNEKLVRYRVGCGVSTVGRSYYDSLHGSVVRATRTAACKIADWECVRHIKTPEEYKARLVQFTQASRRILAELPMWESDRFVERWHSFRETHSMFALNRVLIIHALLLLPRNVARAILDTLYKFLKVS